MLPDYSPVRSLAISPLCAHIKGYQPRVCAHRDTHKHPHLTIKVISVGTVL